MFLMFGSETPIGRSGLSDPLLKSVLGKHIHSHLLETLSNILFVYVQILVLILTCVCSPYGKERLVR